MSGLPISRLICSHDFYWSRRRQADVCRRCGALSPVLALHFRSKSAWTVGADLPPERVNGLGPAVDVDFEAPAATAGETAAPAPLPALAPPSDPLSIPAPVPAGLDFSMRGGAPLQKPLVT